MVIRKLLNGRKFARYPDGEFIGVARPTNPQLAVKLTKELHEKCASLPKDEHEGEWEALQTKLNEECGPYMFVGYMGKPKKKVGLIRVLDEKGKTIGNVEPGDSFVRSSDWQPAGAT